MSEAEYNNASKLKAFFYDNSIQVTGEWLLGCTQYFMSLQPDIDILSLTKSAMFQWKLADLRTMGKNRLPDSLFDEHKDIYKLMGNYPLQMQYILDISESCYDQYRKLHNKELDETDEEMKLRQTQTVKKRRMLKLELTDGIRYIEAMEHKPIVQLSTKLPPGTKVFIKGPVKVINNILFLEPQNINVYGGEVDSLLIENAYENILLKQLKKPITDTPNTKYFEPEIEIEVARPPQVVVVRGAPMPQTYVKPKSETNEPQRTKTNNEKPQSNNKKTQYQSMDDDVFDGVDLDALEKQAKEEAGMIELKQNEIKIEKPIKVIETILIDDEDDDFEMDNLFEQMDQATQNYAPKKSAKPSATITSRDLKEDDSYKYDMEMDSAPHLRTIQKPSSTITSRDFTDYSNSSYEMKSPARTQAPAISMDIDYDMDFDDEPQNLDLNEDLVNSSLNKKKEVETVQPLAQSNRNHDLDYNSRPSTSKTCFDKSYDNIRPTPKPVKKTLTQYGFGSPNSTISPKIQKPSTSWKPATNSPFATPKASNKFSFTKKNVKDIPEKSFTPKAKPKSPAYLDDDDDDDDEEMAKLMDKELKEVLSNQQPPEKTINRLKNPIKIDGSYKNEQVLPPKIPKINKNSSLQFDFTNVFDDDLELNEPDPPKIDPNKFLDESYEYKVNGHNLLTINQLSTLAGRDTKGQNFVVFCYLSGIMEKLRINKNGEWSFGALVTDNPSENDSTFLIIKFGDATLSEITGVTGREMLAMKKEVQQHPAIKHEMEDSFKKIERFFKNQRKFYLQLEYQRGTDEPFGTKIIVPTLEITEVMGKKICREFIKNNIFNN